MQFHTVCGIFPLMSDDEFKGLVVDIAANGLHEAIWTWKGKIIDGRNRYKACQEPACKKAGVKPIYREWGGEGNLLAFVISANLHRRHLNESQRAMIAARLATGKYGGVRSGAGRKTKASQTAKKPSVRLGRVRNDGGQSNQVADMLLDSVTQSAAAKAMKVSPRLVTDAKALLDASPKLAKKVDTGEITVGRAKTTVKSERRKRAIRKYTKSVKALPVLEKTYNVVLADPPWQYSESVNTRDGIAENQYATMPLAEIKNYLKANDIKVAENSVLFLWVTNAFVEKALEVVKDWGFEYKTNVVWVKTKLRRPGVGYYVRGRHELLFICTRGSFTPLNKDVSPPIGSVIEAPVGEHSQKPDEVYSIAERLYPDCLYLELFARKDRKGWDRPAVEHIQANFDALESGAVIDVEFLRGERTAPRQPERSLSARR